MSAAIALPKLVQRITVDTSGLKGASGDFSTFAQRSGRSMARVGDNVTRTMTLPILGLGAVASKLAVNFDRSLSQIVGLVGQSSEAVAEFRTQVLDLAPATGKGPQELADALFFVTSAGFEGAAAMEVLEASAKAATAGLGETAQVADAVTSAVNSYGADVLTAAQATDVLVATVREGKLEAAELAPQLGRLLPLASELGVEFDEVGAGLAFLTRGSGDVAGAATSLGGILGKLLKPTTAAAEALEAVGMSTDGLRQKVRDDGLLAALQELRGALGEDSEAFGRIFEDMRAVQGALALTGAGTEEASAIFDSLADSTGALDSAFSAASETAQFKFDAALATLQATLIDVGDDLLPVITDLVGGVANLVDAFSDLPGPARTALTALAGIVAIGGPFLSVTGRMVASYSTLSDALAARRASEGLGRLTSKLSSAASVAAGPLAIGLAAVAAGVVVARIAAERAENAYDDYREAAEALSGSLGEDGAAKSAAEFAAENAKVIDQLRELDSLSRQNAELFAIGYTLVSQGEDAGEVFARLQQLAFEADISVPLTFNVDSLSDFDVRIAQLREQARGIAGDIADGLNGGTETLYTGDLFNLTDSLRQDLRAIAQEAAAMFDAGNLEGAVALLDAVEQELSAVEGGTFVVADAQNVLADEFAKANVVTGLNITSTKDLRGALQDLTSESSTADRQTRSLAERTLELADTQGLTLTDAIRRAASELEAEAVAAAAAAAAAGQVEDASFNAAQAASELAAETDAAVESLREQQTAVLALADPFFAAADATDRLADSQADLAEAQKEGDPSAVAAAQRDIASSAFEVEAANRELLNSLAESSSSYGELVERLESYVDSGLITQQTADDVAGQFADTGEAASAMVTGIDAAGTESIAVLEALESGAFLTATGLGRSLADGIAAGLDQRVGAVRASASGIVDEALIAAKVRGDVRSPSRLFAVEVGGPLTEGIAEGMLEKLDVAETAVEQVISRLTDKASTSLQSALQALTAGRGIEDATSGLARAEEELAEARQRESVDLPRAVAEAEEALERARRSAAQLPDEIADAEGRLAAARREAARVTDVEARAIEGSEIALERARIALAKLGAEQAALPAKIAAARAAVRESAAGVIDATKDRQSAEQAVREARARAEQIRSAYQEGRADRFNLAEAEGALADAESALAESEREILNAQDNRTSASEELARLEQSRTGQSLDLREAQLRVAEAEDRLAQSRIDAAAPTAEVTELERELERLRDDVTAAGELTAAAERDLADARADLADAADETADAEERLEDATLSLLDAQLRLLESGHELNDSLGQSKELLVDLAEQAGLTTDQIAGLAAALDSVAGQTGTLGGTPAPAAAPTGGAAAGGTYTVRSGDTLSGIASRHGTTVGNLLEKNPAITDPNLINVGQVIALQRGGLADAGDWMLVGERGPELMRARFPSVVAPTIDAAALIDRGDRGRTAPLVGVMKVSAPDTRRAARELGEELSWLVFSGNG